MRRLCLILWILSGALWLQAQFIAGVYEYLPAPGQFINTPWGSPASALTLTGGIEGTMSLGSFGGYVVFGFEKPVENHPDNPFGVDFTIFGNSLEGWAEPGVVRVMKDDNGNGLPDDTWYELAGSEYFFSSTLRDYRVTYSDPGGEGAVDVPWTDRQGNGGVVQSGGYHGQSFYPDPDSFPVTTEGSYELAGTYLPDPVDRSDPAWLRSPPKAFGYADNQPVGDPPYTLPDNPYTTATENSGGDPFDIGWAVDETGQYVDLEAVDFIMVQSACLADGGWLGEISPEIRGAVDVPPLPETAGETLLVVMASLPDTIRGSSYPLEAFAFENGRIGGGKTIGWECSLEGARVDDSEMLHFSVSGEVTVTAFLEERPEIRTSAVTLLEYSGPAGRSPGRRPAGRSLSVHPNPAGEEFTVTGTSGGDLLLMDLSGRRVMEIRNYADGTTIPAGHLPPGMYVLKPGGGPWSKSVKLILR